MSHHDKPPPSDLERFALADRLKKDVVTLATEIGPRSVFIPNALERSAEFLGDRFSQLGFDVRRESFVIPAGLKFTRDLHPDIVIPQEIEVSNIIAEKRGTTRPDEIVIVGAHYDTQGVDTPGANDNASGVAVMLEIARALKDESPERTIRFIGFVNEEPPFTWEDYMGSVVSSRRSKELGESIAGMVALDEIGCFADKGQNPLFMLGSMLLYRDFFRDIVSRIPHDSIVLTSYGNGQSFLDHFSRKFRNHSNVPVTAYYGEHRMEEDRVLPVFDPLAWSDNYGYSALGIPSILVTDTGPLRYGNHYHKTTDTPDRIDYETLARVTQGVIGATKDLVTVGNSE